MLYIPTGTYEEVKACEYKKSEAYATLSYPREAFNIGGRLVA